MNPERRGDLVRGEAFLEAGRPADALPYLGRLAAAEPEVVRIRCLLALAYYQLGRNAEALEAAESACGLDPTSAWAHRLRAHALLRHHRRKEALDAAIHAVNLAPDVWLSHTTVSEISVLTDQPEQAERAAREAIRLAPTESGAYSAGALAALACGDAPLAEARAREALRLDPSNTSSMVNLGIALEQQRRPRAALEAHLGALRLEPGREAAQTGAARASLRHLGVLPPILLIGLLVGYLAGREWLAGLPIERTIAVALSVLWLVVWPAAWLLRYRSLPPEARAALRRHGIPAWHVVRRTGPRVTIVDPKAEPNKPWWTPPKPE